jgi:PAS domain S-box-containing protein
MTLEGNANEPMPAGDTPAKQFQYLERTADAVYTVDPEWTITFWDSQMAQRTGTDPGEVVGENLWDVFGDVIPPELEERYRTVMETGEPAEFEQYIPEPLDYWAEVRVFADESGLSVHSRDATDRKARRSRLRKFERMVQHTGHAVFFTNVDGEIQYVNPSFERMTGYTSAEALGETPHLLTSGEHGDAFFADLWETILDGSTWNGEIVNERKDGTQFIANITIAPVTTDSGTVTNFVAIYDDITERKERERRLQTHELVVQAMNEVAFLVDDRKRIQFANQAVLDFADVSLEAITGLPIESFVEVAAAPDEDPQRVLNAVDSILMDEEPDVGEWIRERDGTETLSLEFELSFESVGRVVVEQRFAPVDLYDGERGVAIVSRDVTTRKEQEETIRTHLEQAQEIGNVGSWHLDLEAAELYWSDECYRIFGIQPGQPMTYERFLSVVHPEDRENVEEAWSAALDGEPYEIEHRIVVDGEVKWVLETAEITFDDAGDPVKGIGVVQDITEQKARENQIVEQKRRFESLFNSIRDPIIVTDTEGRITNCNPGFSRLFGYELDAIEGDSLTTLLADDEELEELLSTDRMNRGSPHSRTVDYQKKSGQVFPGESSVSYLQDYEDSVIGFVDHIRDVSEREENRQQLRVMDRVLRHNIRNEMNVIMGRAEFIRAEGSTEIRSQAGEILETSEEFVELAAKQQKITTLLTESSERERYDVVPAVASAISAVREQHPEATVSTTLPESCPVTATRDVGRAVRELLDNAVTHSETVFPAVDLTVRHGDDVAEIEVRDPGPGIPDLEWKVLTREVEIGPLYHGSGLGLWLVNTIVRQSDGRLLVDENDAGGSTVTIVLRTG